MEISISSENPQKMPETNVVSFHSHVENPKYLADKWDIYYHLPFCKNWDLNSYVIIMKNVDTAEKLIAINDEIPEIAVKQCMLFVMKSGITPRWEDPQNKNGGCFSFKVPNKNVVSVWRTMLFSLCGETLFLDAKYNSLIAGITVSPKKNFCIVKIWMKNCTVQDPNLIVPIPNLIVNGCLFRKHETGGE